MLVKSHASGRLEVWVRRISCCGDVGYDVAGKVVWEVGEMGGAGDKGGSETVAESVKRQTLSPWGDTSCARF